uniref:Si:ch211-173a9.6 n=1 Tax=Neogobius melanostomus TaxID=47308 RepID=A0A8C6TEM5_9GOBI
MNTFSVWPIWLCNTWSTVNEPHPVSYLLLGATVSLEDWESGNVTASVGDSGQCLCHVYAPDTTFPADRVEHMQQVSKDMIIEIQNMTMFVNQLESYDKSNLEVIRIEFAKLQKKLEDCQQDQDFKLDIGNCNGTGIVSLSKPNVIQLNAHLSGGYLYGGWAKDSKPLRGYESMYVYGAHTGPNIYDFYLYRDYDSLILRSNFKRYDLPSGWVGTGNNFAVRGHSIYYQRSTYDMCKINVTSNKYDYRAISEASGSFSYSYSTNQILDFAGDENGLWVMYASEDSKGKIIVAKLDEKSFGIEDKWNTGVYKQLSGNAFMACGVMYATRSVDLTTEEIFYALDTRTGEEQHLSIPFQKFQEKYTYLDYNPTDQKLYMYNNGYYVSYNLAFPQGWQAPLC